MADINFSSQDTGACPYCGKHTVCEIQDAITETLGDLVHDTFDDEMEIVFYRCPEFKAEEITGTDEDD